MNDNPMPPELERKLYYDGIHLFNEHEFFEAHETWEDIWHMAYGLKHEFYQGMIQAAVALEHYRRSNPRGVVRALPTLHRPVPSPLVLAGAEAYNSTRRRSEERCSSAHSAARA